MEFRVEEKDGDIIVTDGVFTAVYFKPNKLDPQLKLKRRLAPTTSHCVQERGWPPGRRLGSWAGLFSGFPVAAASRFVRGVAVWLQPHCLQSTTLKRLSLEPRRLPSRRCSLR